MSESVVSPDETRPATTEDGTEVHDLEEPTGGTPDSELAGAARDSLSEAATSSPLEGQRPESPTAVPTGSGVPADPGLAADSAPAADPGADQPGTAKSGTAKSADDVTAGAPEGVAVGPVDDAGDEDEEDGEDENPLDTEGEIAADYLEELLDIADLDGDIDTYVESDRAHVSIVTDAELLVGPGGEVLEALQELSRLAVMTETGHRSRLMLDVAGYRERRRKVLAGLAAEAVEEARTSGQAVRLSAMNPFERKIVHDAVAAAGLTSESEGEEPNRRVIVMPSR